MKLSEKIALLRKDKGWSQEQLATKLEVSRQAVYKWEADVNQPDLDKLKKISHLFNVSYDILMDDSIELPLVANIVEAEKEEEQEVEILENTSDDTASSKIVHNEVAVQVNYTKERSKPLNKKLIASLCIFIGIALISLSVLSYVIFGIVLQKESYLVKFDTVGGSAVSDLVIKEGKGIDDFTPPTKEGYTFEGWYVGYKKWNFDTDKIKNNVTLTAKWTPNKNTLFFVNSETGDKYEASANTDETVILPTNTFEKSGYTFKGWALSPGGEVAYANCASLQMGTSNLTLYAIWDVAQYTLTLDAKNGEFDITVPDKFTSEDTIVLPTPSLKHYTFDGWYDKNGTKFSQIPKGTTNDVSLTAKYNRIKYSISYELNGGENNVANPSEYLSGVSTIIHSPTKESASFEGWYFEEDFITLIDGALSGLEGKDVTLYAKWSECSFEFEAVSGGYALTYYDGELERVVVPSTYQGENVVEISALAFYQNEFLSEIVIPKTVKRIDVTAFEECFALTKFTVESGNPKFSSIDGVLFNETGTWLYKYPTGREDTVYIAPSSVDVIGPFAFSYAIFLEEIYLPDDPTLTYGIGKVCEGAFEGCISLTKIELGYIANYFEKNCFLNCWSLEQIEFKAQTVWGIEENAFACCMLLEDVIFNCASVKEISNGAFLGCLSLTTIDLSVVEKLGSLVFAESGLLEIYIPKTLTSVGNQLFLDCIYELTVLCEAESKPSAWPSDWSEGAASVLWGQENNNVPPSTATITYTVSYGTVTITNCEGAGVITIPSQIEGMTVTKIGANAFSGQSEITEINIPATVTSIDASAFDDCPSLESINYLGTYNQYVSIDGVLYGDYGRGLLRYPEGKRDEVLTLPYNLHNVRDYAFKNNIYLKKVIFPSDVAGGNYTSTLGLGAFSGCTALEELENCYVTYFNKEAFKDCTSLKELTFHAENITHLSNQVFLNCSSLEKITFKGNVGRTGWQVFGYCTRLKNVVFEGTLEVIGWGCFEGCLSLESFTVPDGVTDISGEAFKNCQSLSRIEISSSVTTIGENAFLYAPLMYVNIPSTVTTISDYAFSGIYDLFIFCEAEEKPAGWGEKWNYSGETETAAPYKTYWGEIYEEPTFEFSIVSGGSYHIKEIRNIKNKILILPSMNGTSEITALSLFETDLFGVEEIFISNWMGKTYDVTWSFTGDLKAIYVATLNQNFCSVDGVLYSKDKTELIYYPRNKENTEYVAIKELKTIKMDSFCGAKNLTSLVLYNDIEGYGVTKIENDSFSYCPKLSSIYFGKSITNIGSEAFDHCNALTSLEFTNENPLTIGAYTFYSCENLKSVSFKGADTTIETYAFHLCENISALDLTGVVSIGHCAFSAGANLKQVFIPSTVVEMSDRAFDYPSVITFYCQPTERPSGWNERWVGKTASVEILWGQSGLPED